MSISTILRKFSYQLTLPKLNVYARLDLLTHGSGNDDVVLALRQPKLQTVLQFTHAWMKQTSENYRYFFLKVIVLVCHEVISYPVNLFCRNHITLRIGYIGLGYRPHMETINRMIKEKNNK